MAMNRQRKTSNINNIVQYDASGNVTLAQIPLASTAAAHVIISDNKAVKYRTVTQFYGDLGFPAQTGQNGKILSTDGSTLSWIANAGITNLTGDVTANGPGSVAATIPNTIVTGKTLTGLSIAGTAVTSSDSILIAIGKLQNQVNGLTGTLIYKGSWNAATNTPTITSGVGVAGNFYIVTTAGSTTIDGVTPWAVGDWIIFSGSAWQKVPNTNTVTSVNTYTGAVVLKTDDIAESVTPTNLWFTNTRSRNAISLTTNNNSGAATYTAGTGVFNIPNYTLAGLGGFANPMSALGDIIYGGASGAATRLAGNTAAAKRFLVQTGDGTISAAPTWGTIAVGDVPTLNQNTTGSAATLNPGRNINGVAFNGSADITITANTTNAITFNNGGSGAASGTTFNGSVARTISYNTIGAQGALTLTTTGSGAATLVGNTLNIPTPSAVSTGNLTESTSSVLTITGGTGAVVGAGTSIQVKQASSSQSGFLSSTDWSTFNSKQNALTNPVTGTGSLNQIAYFTSNGTTIGSLSTGTYPSLTELSYVKGVTSAIQTQLDSKQPSGNYVTGSATVGYYPITSGSTTNIGTSSLLEVSGITRNTGSGFITGVSNGYWFGTSTTGITGISGYSTSNTLVLYTGSTERIMINSSGRVLVNTTSDAGASYQFQVNGATYSTGGFFESSDITLKDVIIKSESDTFGTIEYTWKDARDSKKHWGYSAQDVQRWIPDAVEIGSDGSLSLDYNQAHSWKIMQLENKIKELEAKLAK